MGNPLHPCSIHSQRGDPSAKEHYSLETVLAKPNRLSEPALLPNMPRLVTRKPLAQTYDHSEP